YRVVIRTTQSRPARSLQEILERSPGAPRGSNGEDVGGNVRRRGSRRGTTRASARCGECRRVSRLLASARRHARRGPCRLLLRGRLAARARRALSRQGGECASAGVRDNGADGVEHCGGILVGNVVPTPGDNHVAAIGRKSRQLFVQRQFQRVIVVELRIFLLILNPGSEHDDRKIAEPCGRACELATDPQRWFLAGGDTRLDLSP